MKVVFASVPGTSVSNLCCKPGIFLSKGTVVAWNPGDMVYKIMVCKVMAGTKQESLFPANLWEQYFVN